MWKRILLLATLGLAALAPARDKPENWVQVRSPHSLVVGNSNEKQARRVADQFERMRSVFHKLFPKLQIDPATPIIVLTIKDEKDFRALEPGLGLTTTLSMRLLEELSVTYEDPRYLRENDMDERSISFP